MNIDELYHTINEECGDEKERESKNDKDSTIIRTASIAAFVTIIRSDNNECTIKSRKRVNNDFEFPYKGFTEFACNKFEKDKVLFCTKYCRRSMCYRCHPRYGNS